MSIVYDKLMYVGKGKGAIIEILPSRVSIKVTKDRPYIFRACDSLDEKSIKYYKSLELSVGVKLHEIIDEEAKSKSINEINNDSDLNNSPQEVANKVPEVNNTLEPNEKEPIEEVKSESTSEVVNNKLEASNSEMIEFLDMNYSDEELRVISKDCGIKRVMSSWDKETLISKIISSNPEYVVNLMKRS